MNKQMFILKVTIFWGKVKRSHAFGGYVCVCICVHVCTRTCKGGIIRQYLFPSHVLSCKNSQSMKEPMQIDTLFIILAINTNSWNLKHNQVWLATHLAIAVVAAWHHLVKQQSNGDRDAFWFEHGISGPEEAAFTPLASSSSLHCSSLECQQCQSYI